MDVDDYTEGGARRRRAKHAPSKVRKGGCDDEREASITAILVVLAVILIVAVVFANCRRGPRNCNGEDGGSNSGASRPPSPARMDEAFHTTSMPSPDAMDWNPMGGPPERRSVHAALSRLYSTADVDPLVTGQLYAHADHVRNVYAQRTSHGDVHGLTEYSSNGAPGDVGVDVGPYGLEEYGGKMVGFDDGIPEPWAMPSTPVRWYGPKQRDYYGIEGPTVYSEGLYSLSEPDHDPLVN